jgi:hypothetical protein
VIPSATAIASGILVIFSGLFGSLLTLRIANPQVASAGTDPDQDSPTSPAWPSPLPRA